jgi:hypothetical protein
MNNNQHEDDNFNGGVSTDEVVFAKREKFPEKTLYITGKSLHLGEGFEVKGGHESIGTNKTCRSGCVYKRR